MNIYNLYSTIGPWVTPAPAAIALATRLYGQQEDKISAIAIATFSLLALEIVGGLCTEDMMHSSLRREWKWFSVSFIGVLVYAGLGIYALWGATAWIYVVLAVFVHIAATRKILLKKERETEIENHSLVLNELTVKTDLDIKAEQAKLEQRKLDLALERERTKQIKAEKAVAYDVVTTKNVEASSKKSYICPYCDVDQEKAQRYSVHMRYCSKKSQG